MIEAPQRSAFGSPARRPWLAALLSFVFPGLGQAYAGTPWLAALFAVPVLVLLAVIAIAVLGSGADLTNRLLSARFLLGVLAVNAALLVWRAAAVIHGGLLTPTRSGRAASQRATWPTVVALVLATVAMHAWVGMAVIRLEGTLSQVFGGANPAPDRGDVPRASGDPTPAPAGWNGTDRLNFLLLGTDAAPGREAALTDVIMVVSVDPAAGEAVMISVPRDTGFIPLPDTSVYASGLFPQKVNELAAHATRDAASWCPDLAHDPETCGIRAISQSVGLYLGLEIHHYAVVDMVGFAEMIDAVGGLELCLPGQLVDPEFDGSLGDSQTDEPLILPAGCHHYDGLGALSYARSRKGWIEMPDGTREPQNDFSRSERQQKVLLSLREELAEADTFFELPDLLAAIGRTATTDFPREQAGDLASLLPLITGPEIERVVLGYPDFVDLPLQPDLNYLLTPRREAIREKMEEIFGAGALRGWYLDSTAPGPGEDPSAGSSTP